MASIQADTDTAFIFYPVDDIFKLPELASQITALSGCVFYYCRYSFSLFKGDIDTFCDKCQTIFYRYFIERTARVEIE